MILFYNHFYDHFYDLFYDFFLYFFLWSFFTFLFRLYINLLAKTPVPVTPAGHISAETLSELSPVHKKPGRIQAQGRAILLSVGFQIMVYPISLTRAQNSLLSTPS